MIAVSEKRGIILFKPLHAGAIQYVFPARVTLFPAIVAGMPRNPKIADTKQADRFWRGSVSNSNEGIGMAVARRKIGKRRGFAPFPKKTAENPARTGSSEKASSVGRCKIIPRR